MTTLQDVVTRTVDTLRKHLDDPNSRSNRGNFVYDDLPKTSASTPRVSVFSIDSPFDYPYINADDQVQTGMIQVSVFWDNEVFFEDYETHNGNAWAQYQLGQFVDEVMDAIDNNKDSEILDDKILYMEKMDETETSEESRLQKNIIYETKIVR